MIQHYNQPCILTYIQMCTCESICRIIADLSNSIQCCLIQKFGCTVEHYLPSKLRASMILLYNVTKTRLGYYQIMLHAEKIAMLDVNRLLIVPYQNVGQSSKPVIKNFAQFQSICSFILQIVCNVFYNAQYMY